MGMELGRNEEKYKLLNELRKKDCQKLYSNDHERRRRRWGTA
jgi:hypothetical protein